MIPPHIETAALWLTNTDDLTTALLRLMDATEKRCPKCGRPFVFQMDGPKRQPHRNARFCSNGCARAAAQAAYRARARVAKREPFVYPEATTQTASN